MVLITIVTGAYKPTYNWGASPCTGFFVDTIILPEGIPNILRTESTSPKHFPRSKLTYPKYIPHIIQFERLKSKSRQMQINTYHIYIYIYTHSCSISNANNMFFFLYIIPTIYIYIFLFIVCIYIYIYQICSIHHVYIYIYVIYWGHIYIYISQSPKYLT